MDVEKTNKSEVKQGTALQEAVGGIAVPNHQL